MDIRLGIVSAADDTAGSAGGPSLLGRNFFIEHQVATSVRSMLN